MPTRKLKFLRFKSEIDKYLLNLLNQRRKSYLEHSQADMTFDYLQSFVNAGKTVRGSLFLEALAELLPEDKNIEAYYSIAAGIELVHSALLIQDDYMDQDSSRRGMQSLHTDLLELAQTKNYRNATIYSPSALMCITDIIFFLAFEQIASTKCSAVAEVFRYVSEEYSHVGFSQWKDVSLANRKGRLVDREDIELVYKYKTARYTFVAPVRIAGIVAGTSKDALSDLDLIMEDMGMIFQIRDDYLSLFGDEEITGKPVGGDIIEDKKTLYQYYFFQEIGKLSRSEQEQVLGLYGKKQLTKSEITLIQSLHKKLGVTKLVDEQVKKYKKEIQSSLKRMQLSDDFKQRIMELLDFVAEREK